MQPPDAPLPPYPSYPSDTSPAILPPPGAPLPMPPGYVPPYPVYPSLYPTPYAGYQPPPKRRVPWWGQLIALLVPPPIAMVIGSPILGLLIWGAYGDSPTPPQNADYAMRWAVASFVCVGVLFGLGVHAIVIRKPWIFLAGCAVTVAVFFSMVWAYLSLY